MKIKKPMQALALFAAVLADSVRRGEDELTQRQLAILLQIYLASPPHTVRGLSAGLAIPKPAISRALDTLSIKGLVRRARDEADRRNVIVHRTVKGAVFLSDFAETIAEHMGKAKAA